MSWAITPEGWRRRSRSGSPVGRGNAARPRRGWGRSVSDDDEPFW